MDDKLILEVKRLLENISADQIRFNEPHFTYRVVQRGASNSEIIAAIMCPERLIKVTKGLGRLGDTKYELHFNKGETQMIIPVIFTKKGLYVITYIERYRL